MRYNLLLNCPFCGNEDIHIAHYAHPEYFAIECSNRECLMSVSGATREEAVKRWNKRADISAELKNCPLCGSPAYLYTYVDEDTGETDYTVNCTNCEAQSIRDNDRQAVIDRWNRRVKAS